MNGINITETDYKNGWDVLFERSHDAMIMLNSTLDVIDLNKAANEICNVGENLAKVEHITSQDNERRSISESARWALEYKQPCEGRIIYLARKHADVSVDIYPIDHPISGLVLIIKDQTEALNHDHRSEQPDKLLRLGMTAAGMTHELSNPLTALSSELELMQASADEEDPHLNNCLHLVSRMRTILRELSGIIDTDVSLRELPVDVERYLRQAINLIHFCPQGSQVNIETVFDESLPQLLVAEKHFFILLENICENAIKAADHDGSVQVSAMKEASEGIRISILNSGRNVLPPEHKFSSHYQQGMGVGLLISKQIMQSYGGKLLLSRTDDGGTRVDLHFPKECCVAPLEDLNIEDSMKQTVRNEQ